DVVEALEDVEFCQERTQRRARCAHRVRDDRQCDAVLTQVVESRTRSPIDRGWHEQDRTHVGLDESGEQLRTGPSWQTIIERAQDLPDGLDDGDVAAPAPDLPDELAGLRVGASELRHGELETLFVEDRGESGK